MANVTRDLQFTKSGYVKAAWPNNVFTTNGSTDYKISHEITHEEGRYYLFLGGATGWPSSLRHNRIISASVRIYIKTGNSTLEVTCVKDFNPSSLTYNNDPDTEGGWGSGAANSFGLNVNVWSNVWVPISSGNGYNQDYYMATDAIKMLKNGAVRLYGGSYNTDFNLSPYPWYAKTVLSDGSKPFVRITYSDSEIVRPQVSFSGSYPSGSNVNPRNAQTFSWKLSKRSEDSDKYCYDETWTQVSAILRWRVQGATGWNESTISGSTMSKTFPAYTFPTGQTIEYYVQVTDTDGYTATSSTRTFSTPPSQITQQNCPTSGYANPRNAIPFSWYFKNTAGDYEQQSASLFWREAGDTEWTEIQASGSTMSLTVPADTFPIASTVEWYLYGTDSSGSSSQTPTYSFSTSASLIDAVCKTPVNSVEDGSAPIRFTWELWSNDGYAASRTIFMWKKASDSDTPANWHTEMDVDRTVIDITANANLFPAGEIDWKVVCYNIDGIEGSWGSASFVCVAAPNPVLGLAATPVPLTTISWQSEGQQAYEITIDGEVVQRAWGPAVYSWKVPEPLAEGEHVISVRIQGIYELWSQPAETSIQVGGPRSQGVLSAEFGADAVLRHSLNDAATEIRWYRDGKLIGTSRGDGTAPAEFRDRRVLGEHSYFARYWWNNGEDYDQTNTVTGTMRTETTLIADLDDYAAPWQDLRLTDSSSGREEYSWSRGSATQHVHGSKWPRLERSEFEELSAGFNIAFRYKEDIRAFETLLGKTVILKSRGDHVMVGMLGSVKKTVRRFYTSYSFRLEQIHAEDFVEVTGP